MTTLPPDFILRSRSLLGDEYDLLEAALQREATASVRMNADKPCGEPEGERIPWCETGYYLPKRRPFTFDPLFHAGAYYVQEPSSMFLEQALKAYVKKAVKCLDLCAAPGGKSTHLCSLLPQGSLLVGNETIRSRANVLAENLCKWGNPSVIVSRNEPAEIGRLKHFFDLVVVDAPCSGEGLFRKDPAAAGQWSPEAVSLCAARQRRILRQVWGALKPGGILVYSTCTYTTEENEDVVAYLVEELGAAALPVPARAEWQVAGALKGGYPACRFFPHRLRGEGFFLAVVRKEAGGGQTEECREGGFRKKKRQGEPPLPAGIGRRLLHPEEFHIERRGNLILAFPLRHLDSYLFLREQLRLVASGVCLGEVKGNDLLPAHSLAMCRELNRDSFAAAELSREEAVRYLRKEALMLPGEKAYALVTYKGLPLGFVKRLGTRANNLYPQQWRIRSR
jgi:16S rRNA C967 or C1407 C5-methylase (RsmB/RsmF family)/NOL1/NOP2/fmu family ribosome biogenesis protein